MICSQCKEEKASFQMKNKEICNICSFENNHKKEMDINKNKFENPINKFENPINKDEVLKE